MNSGINIDSAPRFSRVAAPWHAALVIVGLAINAYSGFLRSAALRQAHSVNRPALYIRTIIIEWLVLAGVLAGVWLHRSSLYAVLGQRWGSLSQFFRDLGIAIAFLFVTVSVSAILGPHAHQVGTDPAVRFLMPDTANEKWLWVLLSISAGICEEAVYRGYLQRQFIAFTGNIPAGIGLSAALFAMSHAYQGFRPALLVGFGGLLSGALALWRKSVRPGMIAHTLQDLLALFVQH